MTPVPESVKLELLSIDEVSGVDHGANLLDGWMVQKAGGPGYPIGPDQSWDVSAAEKRVRSACDATDAPNEKYAGCFLYKSGDGSNFGDYKFLVCDVVGGDIKVMPQAIRAAASRLSGSSLSSTEKASVQSKISGLESKAGIGDANKSEEGSSILAKVRDLIFPGLSTEGEVDMTPEEVNEQINAALAPLTEKLDEISKSAEAAPATEGAASTEPEATPAAEVALTDAQIEQVTKAVAEAIKSETEPLYEVAEKTLDRIEALEKRSGVRKSLEGQETQAAAEGETETKPTVEDAILKALRNPGNPLAVAAFAEKE
jgi:hypothetical protein